METEITSPTRGRKPPNTPAHDSDMPNLIGIRGGIGHGKDSLGAEICKMFPEYQVRKFATPVRHAASIITDISVEKMQSSPDKKAPLPARKYEATDFIDRVAAAIRAVTRHAASTETVLAVAKKLVGPGWETFLLEGGGSLPPLSVGRLLQILGTECFRAAVGENVWVDATLAPWRAAGCPPTVITDVRFPNESAAIRAAGGVVVLVVRTDAECDDGRSPGHASEHALVDEDPDAVIPNNGTLADLARAFKDALPSLCDLSAVRKG
jgi:hypothetical protein